MMLLVDIVGGAGGDDGKSIRMESSILLSPGVSGIWSWSVSTPTLHTVPAIIIHQDTQS